MIPYSAEVFLAVMADYNRAIWPAQVVALVAGLVSLALLVARMRSAGRFVAVLLAAAWVWTGWAWHYGTMADISFWAYGFAGAFVLQGVLLAWSGWRLERFRYRGEAADILGGLLCVVGLVGYPVLVWAAGHDPDEIGWFAVAPAPTAVFTLGALLLARPVPIYAFVIPAAWCIVGTGVARELGMPHDYVLAGALALTAIGVVLSRRRVRSD